MDDLPGGFGRRYGKVLETRLDLSTALASSSGWTKDWESSLSGLELVQETTDKVVLVKEKPKAARDHQKSYVDFRSKPLEFEVEDHVLLRVSPWLRLPEELNSVHETFHVSNLKKCLADAS
ncbi:hypothetical protein Tco_0267555 [Tanacetum coccineum]